MDRYAVRGWNALRAVGRWSRNGLDVLRFIFARLFIIDNISLPWCAVWVAYPLLILCLSLAVRAD